MLELRRTHANDMTAPHKLDARIAFLLTLPPILWAGNAIVGRLAVGTAPPVALNAVRWAIAALLLIPVAWPVLRDARWRRVPRLRCRLR